MSKQKKYVLIILGTIILSTASLIGWYQYKEIKEKEALAWLESIGAREWPGQGIQLRRSWDRPEGSYHMIDYESQNDLIFGDEYKVINEIGLKGKDVKDISLLKYFDYLEHLNLVGTEVKDISSISGCSSLKSLHVFDSPIEDFSVLARTELTHLSLDVKQIDLKVIKRLPLESLAVYCESVLNVESISKLENLEALSLAKMDLTDIGFLTELKELKFLVLVNLNVSDLSPLKKLNQLSQLNLQNTKVGQQQIDDLNKALPDLDIINFSK